MKQTRRGVIYTATGVTGLTVTAGAASASNQSCPRTDSIETNDGDDGDESNVSDESDESDSQEPTAVLSASETSIDPGTDVEFDASESTGDIKKHAWQFGDGTDPVATTDDTITHAYEEPGEYDVVLAVCDASGEVVGDSVSITVTTDQEESTETSFEAKVEAAIHDEVNAIRDEEGLDQLAYDDRIVEIARDHSQEMADEDFLEHQSSNGDSVRDRFNDAGITCEVYAENILYRGVNEDPTAMAKECVESWMDNRPHRENILDDRWDTEGVGIAINDSGRLYATQNFAMGCD